MLFSIFFQSHPLMVWLKSILMQIQVTSELDPILPLEREETATMNICWNRGCREERKMTSMSDLLNNFLSMNHSNKMK